MKRRLKNVYLKSLAKFKVIFGKYIKVKDLIMLGILLALSNSAYLLLTWLYPNTGEPSFQWLYWLLFGLTRTIAIIGTGYLFLSIIMPKAFTYLEDVLFKKDIEKIEPWQRIRYYTFLYCFFIVVFLLSVITISK